MKPIMYSCFAITSIIGVVMSGLVLVFRYPLLSLYGVVAGEEGSLQRMALEAANVRMRLIVVPYFLCGTMEVCTGVLRGMGKSLTSTVISLIGACLLRVIWIWTVFPASQTLETIFVSYPITWIATTLTAFVIIQVLLKRILNGKCV